MERGGRRSLGTFFFDGPMTAGSVVSLAEELVHHLHVRRVEAGERITLLDGAGGRAEATLERLAKRDADASIESVHRVDAPPPVHLLAPVGDRDRMLWLAEKSVELGVTSWRPVRWHRSQAVSPRGAGEAFARKVRARVTGALGQSGGAWLPELFSEADPREAIAALPNGGTRLYLEMSGSPALAAPARPPIVLALGPEGGFEDDEQALLLTEGFRPTSIAANILRFETAGVAALAIVRAQLALGGE